MDLNGDLRAKLGRRSNLFQIEAIFRRRPWQLAADDPVPHATLSPQREFAEVPVLNRDPELPDILRESKRPEGAADQLLPLQLLDTSSIGKKVD